MHIAFTERRLMQLKPIGARMGVQYFTEPMVWVSSIQFGDGVWTRVENETGTVLHFPGSLGNHEAAARFYQEITRLTA